MAVLLGLVFCACGVLMGLAAGVAFAERADAPPDTPPGLVRLAAAVLFLAGVGSFSCGATLLSGNW